MMIEGQKLRDFRTDCGVRAVDLADRLGVSRQYVSEVELSPSVVPIKAREFMIAVEAIAAKRAGREPHEIEIVATTSILVGGREYL